MTATAEGVEAFVEDLEHHGARPQAIGGHVVYVVEAVEGRFAGEIVETAVDLSELARWPLVPPHWVHLPGEVQFANTNSRPSPLSGWVQHSRQITGWGRDTDPASGWLAHVRGVVGDAR